MVYCYVKTDESARNAVDVHFFDFQILSLIAVLRHFDTTAACWGLVLRLFRRSVRPSSGAAASCGESIEQQVGCSYR